jgi:adenylosuccinate synthase
MRTAVIGMQFGDEGKGKVVDYLLYRDPYEYVVRYNGGPNAGHTVNVNNNIYIFHHLPSGVLHKYVENIIASGVVIDPETLFFELYEIGRENIRPKLKIDYRANLILPYHKILDAEKNKKIGTTKRGIGPAYESKIGREGLRIGEVFDEKGNVDEEFLHLYLENFVRERLEPFGLEADKNIEEIEDALKKYLTQLHEYLADTRKILYSEIRNGKNILFEGAQGILLDIDWGTYPYVTSSSTGVNGIYSGTGVNPYLDNVVGVIKAYTTRVGEGPFPSEFKDEYKELENFLRTKGYEYGSTTGRPRRCGALDLVALKYAKELVEPDMLFVTKLDVLSGLDKIPYCVEYEIDGERTSEFPSKLRELQKAKPIFEFADGWKGNISQTKKWANLPKNAKRYIRIIEETLQVPVKFISVGPSRDQTIKKIF